MGEAHTRGYSALRYAYPDLGLRAELIMAADREPSRVAHATEVLGYAAGTTDYVEVLADERIEVVSICSPNFLHAEMAIAAARAGKHFWIEKPVGRGVDETRAVAAAVAEAGVITSIGFNYRHVPVVEHLRRLIADGRLGTITNVRARFFAGYSADPRSPLSWRFTRRLAGSGVLGDLGSHAADLCTYLVGPITEVAAVTSIVHRQRPIPATATIGHAAAIEDGELGPVENEDYAGALVRFADGAVGTVEASRVAVGPDCAYGIEIYGTAGSAMWDFERMGELRLFTGQGTAEPGYATVNANPHHGEFARFQPGAGMAMSFDDLKTIEARKFLVAVTGGPRENSTIEDAVAAAAFVTAAERSAESGRWEPVSAP
jgi:predicted dehydrogenase